MGVWGALGSTFGHCRSLCDKTGHSWRAVLHTPVSQHTRSLVWSSPCKKLLRKHRGLQQARGTPRSPGVCESLPRRPSLAARGHNGPQPWHTADRAPGGAQRQMPAVGESWGHLACSTPTPGRAQNKARSHSPNQAAGGAEDQGPGPTQPLPGR